MGKPGLPGTRPPRSRGTTRENAAKATSVSNSSTQSAQRSRRPGRQDRNGHSGWPAFTRWRRLGATLQYPFSHPNGKQLHHPDNQQRVAQGEGVRYSVCQEDEQTAAGEAANVDRKSVV